MTIVPGRTPSLVPLWPKGDVGRGLDKVEIRDFEFHDT
jgi:hypothetical protein